MLDARIPFSSRNPDIDTLAKNKSRMILLNKSDLSDKDINKLWMDYYKEKGIFCIQINSRSQEGIKQINSMVVKACSDKIERDKRKGIMNRPIRGNGCWDSQCRKINIYQFLCRQGLCQNRK